MKHMRKKSFLILALLALANVSASFASADETIASPEEQEESTSAQQPSRLKRTGIVAASVVANAAAVAAIGVATSYVVKGMIAGAIQFPLNKLDEKSDIIACGALIAGCEVAGLLSIMKLVDLNSYLVDKLGLKTNKLLVGLLAQQIALIGSAYHIFSVSAL